MESRCRLLILRGFRRVQNSNKLAAVQRRIRARRRAILLLCISTILVLSTELLVPNPRSTWVFYRSTRWWEDVVLRNFTDHDWMENFRNDSRELRINYVPRLLVRIERRLAFTRQSIRSRSNWFDLSTT